MTTINIILVCTGLLVLVVGIPHPIQEADNSTKCEFSQLPTRYLSVGKTVSVPGECMRITCQENLRITGLTCPTYFPAPGCRMTDIDRFKEYPHCCPQMFCSFDRYRIRKRRHNKYKYNPY